MGFWYSIRGGLAGLIAFIACPCHLPLTIPALLAVTAGTSIGGWLVANTALLYITSTILFLGGLFLAFVWMRTDEKDVCSVDLKEKHPT